MSSRTPAPPARTWRALAAVLAVVLVLVLAAGLWARWRPLSDDDAARLEARVTVQAVRADLHPDPQVLPDAVLADQEAAFGPAATPSQTRHLQARGSDATPRSLDDAAAQLADLARTTRDGDLAATAASVAASWWAAGTPPVGSDAGTPGASENEAGAGGGSPAPSDGPSAARDGDDATGVAPSSCEPEELAAVTALDRSRFTAEAAAARIPADEAATNSAVEAVRETLDEWLHDSAVTPLLSCDPAPVAGGYVLPADFAEDPARAVGGALHEANAALVAAVAAASPEDRERFLTALRETAHAAQYLDPRQPVAALPGRD